MARKAKINRETKETKISAFINLDGAGIHAVSTGIGFLDHMLNTFTLHGGFDLELKCDGDLQVDPHHTAEDVGIVLGSAVRMALGETPIVRYGSARIPMDESLASCAIDVSARPFLVFNAAFVNERVGELDTQCVEDFMRAFAFNGGFTLHINLDYGTNDHHKVEAIFKALAYALKRATRENSTGRILSAKGKLD